MSPSSSLLVVILLIAAAVASVSSQALPNCKSKCGLVENIFYPFGLGEGCFRDDGFGFELVCKDTYSPPKLFRGDFEITEMLPSQGQLRANMNIARNCYDADGTPLNRGILKANLSGSIFSFSAEKNRFVVTGCDTLVYMSDFYKFNFSTGCLSICSSLTTLRNGTCSGSGCCVTEIPVGLKNLQIDFRTFYNHTKVHYFNPCSYAMLVEEDRFDFNTSWLSVDYTYNRDVTSPVVLDWSIEGETDCEKARINDMSYACRGPKSECVQSTNGLGYLCNCSKGYEGNPYMEDGCQDVDECKHSDLYPCYGVCNNTLGDYNCTCLPGFHSDNPKTMNCTSRGGFRDRIPSRIKLAAGIGCGLFFLVIILSLACWEWQRRHIKELKRKFFEQNGGVDLQQYIESSLQDKHGSLNMFRIFKLKELEKATRNFDETHLLGEGGNGAVFKGVLDNNKVVAVKKSIGIDKSKNKEFAKEIFFLSQTNHVNVVKLLGCCLEVDVPLLVYEYMANGTLSQCIHDRRPQDEPIPWAFRLRLAAESAKAFAYLHSEASPPILHGDVKSTNILLNDNYTAKVSDFGTSIHAPKQKAQTNAFVQGTLGYLDPEYLQTGKLNDKSDVYSFGVILAELLTGRRAITEDGKYLSSTFLASMKSGHDNLLNILDQNIMTGDGSVLTQVRAVADLTFQCLNLHGENRPKMTMISEMLTHMLQDIGSHSWMPSNQVENERLVGHGDSQTMTIGVSNTEYGPLEIEGAR